MLQGHQHVNPGDWEIQPGMSVTFEGRASLELHFADRDLSGPVVPPSHGVSAKGRKEHVAENHKCHPARPSQIPLSLSDSPLNESHPLSPLSSWHPGSDN